MKYNIEVRFYSYRDDKKEITTETHYWNVDADVMLNIIDVYHSGSATCEVVITGSYEEQIESEV